MTSDERSASRRARPAHGCLLLFALPFCIAGLCGLGIAARELVAPAPDWKRVGLALLCGIVFGGAGTWIAAAGILGAKKARERRELEAAHPDAPWLWRPEWATGTIECDAKRSIAPSWGFAIAWNLLSSPVLVFLPEEVVDKGNTLALIALVFPLVGVWLVAIAVRATLRWRKFGSSSFEMAALPASPGRRLAGVVHVPSKLRPEDGFHVMLSCVHRFTSGSGDDRRTRESFLWQDEQTMARELLESDAFATAVPISIELPDDATVTRFSEGGEVDEIVWRLEVRAAVPGVDYAVTFEVPVFAVAGAPSAPAPPIERDDPVAAYRSERDHHAERSGIRVELSTGGATELYFPAARHPGPALALTVFFGIFAASTAFLAHVDAPILFPIVFGGFTLLLGVCTLELWLWTSHVRFDEGGLRLRWGPLGLGRTQEVGAGDIADIRVEVGMRSGRNAYHDVRLVTSAGRRLYVGRHIRSKRQAEEIADMLRDALTSHADRREPAAAEAEPVAAR